MIRRQSLRMPRLRTMVPATRGTGLTPNQDAFRVG